MNQIQELKFFEESEGFLYSSRIIDSFYAAVSIEKLILSIIENSQIDFLQTGGEDNSKDIGPIDLSRYANIEKCSLHRLYL